MHLRQWFHCSWPSLAAILWCPVWAALATGSSWDIRAKNGPMPLAELSGCVSDLHPSPALKTSLLMETWVHKWGQKEYWLVVLHLHTHSDCPLDEPDSYIMHWSLEGLMFLSLYFLNIHLKPQFLKKLLNSTQSKENPCPGGFYN